MNDALGRQLIGELYGCNPKVLDSVVLVEDAMVTAARKANATVINATFHHFSPYGVSGVVVIQESHLAVHTWPEYGYASIDFYTCGDSVDPSIALAHLSDIFKAESTSVSDIKRGSQGKLLKTNYTPKQTNPINLKNMAENRNIWFSAANKHSIQTFQAKDKGTFIHKEWQKSKTFALGDVLVKGSEIKLDNKSAAVKHEMLTHIPLSAKLKLNNILVFGLEGGGLIKEIGKHQHFNQVYWKASMEEQKIATEYFKLNNTHSEKVYTTPTLPAHTTFDLIILNENLLKDKATEIIEKAVSLLSNQGVVTVDLGRADQENTQLKENITTIEEKLGKRKVHYYIANILGYRGGLHLFALIGDEGYQPQKDTIEDITDRLTNNYEQYYYTSQIHSSAFALPAFLERFIKKCCPKLNIDN